MILANKQLMQTFDTNTMTLKDWVNLASKLGYKIGWAYNNWSQTTDAPLAEFTIEDWMECASLLDKSDSWAFARYKEFKNSTSTTEPVKAQEEAA